MEWGAICFTTGMVLGWLPQLLRFQIIDGIILLGDFRAGKMEKRHCPKCWVVGGVIKIWFYQLLKFSAFTTKMFGYNDQLDDIEENRAIKDNVPLRCIFHEYPRSEGFHANNEPWIQPRKNDQVVMSNQENCPPLAGISRITWVEEIHWAIVTVYNC